MTNFGYVPQGGAAGRADAGEAQDDAAQVQASMAAAAVKEDASTATHTATCASAGDGLADSSTPVSQDKHAGDCLIRTVLSQCPPGLPHYLSLACCLASCRCRVGWHCTPHRVDNDGRCTAGHSGSLPQTGGPVASRTCGAKRRAEAEASVPVCHSKALL